MKGKKRSAKSTDFPRKKRKLGKGKRPAENATNISFKSRSIVVPSQLEQSQQPTGKRKLTFEALLRHLNHFKPSMRSDGLTGLRELFQDHPHLLIPNLAQLISSILGRIIDSDASVRHALNIFLNFLFSNVSSDFIRAHFSSVVLHVSCGMTHISDRIQLDSLKIFSLLLNHYPALLPPHAQHLLPLIVGLISRHNCSISQKSAKGKVESSLAHDPRSKLSKLSSRMEVFNLLLKFLESLFERVSTTRKRVSPHLLNPGTNSPIIDLRDQKVLVERDGELLPAHSSLCDFSTSVPHVMVLQQKGLVCQLGSSSLPGATWSSSRSLIETASESVFPDVLKFLEFSESLISLLLECWVECAPSKLLSSKSQSSNIPKGTLSLMETVISLLCLVLKLATLVGVSDFNVQSIEQVGGPSDAALSVLSEKYAASFVKHFMVYFPLHCASTSTNFAQYMKMNLLLCQTTILVSKSEQCFNEGTLQSICKFYSTIGQMTNPDISSQSALECSRIISETLPELVAVVDRYRLPDSSLQSVASGLDVFYNGCHLQSSAKRCLIQCFRNMLDSCGSCSRVFSLFLLPWLESLPKLLVDLGQSNPPLSAFVIDSLASAAAHIPLQQLEYHLVSIIGPNSIISQLPPATQKRFVELLWLVPTLHPKLQSLVREWVCSDGHIDTEVASYLVEVVHHRFLRKKDGRDSLVDTTSQYLTFMVGVLLGGSKCEGNDGSIQSHTNIYTLVEGESDIQYRIKIIKTVCECLKSTYFSDQILELALPTLQATLEGIKTLSATTALAILSLVQSLSSCGAISSTLIPPLSLLSLSVLLARENSVQQSALLDACFAAVHHLLKNSQELLLSLLERFATEIRNSSSTIDLCRGIAFCLISLLDSTELNSPLRACSAVVHSTASEIAEFLASHHEQSLSLRIQHSITKFPPNT